MFYQEIVSRDFTEDTYDKKIARRGPGGLAQCLGHLANLLASKGLGRAPIVKGGSAVLHNGTSRGRGSFRGMPGYSNTKSGSQTRNLDKRLNRQP